MKARAMAGVLALAGIGLAACAPGYDPAPQGPAAAPVPIAQKAPAPTGQMAPGEALGLWQTSFGPVKIAAAAADKPQSLMGVWVYERDGQEIIGYFEGELAGNVLSFSWHEPAGSPGITDDLTGGGYLTFNTAERRFFGRWWSHDGQLSGEWTGQRPAPAAPAASNAGDRDSFAGQGSAADPAPAGDNIAPGPPPPRPQGYGPR